MGNDLPTEHVRTAWQNQESEGIAMSIEDVIGKARNFQKEIRRRNSAEYIAAAAVAAFFGFMMWVFENGVLRVGAGLCITGALYVSVQLHRRGSARTAPADLGLTSCLEFYRNELERQRDLLRGIWWWYLGPMIPGLAVFVVGLTLMNRGHLPHAWWITGGYAVFAAVVFFLIARSNQRCANELQRQIDELQAAARE